MNSKNYPQRTFGSHFISKRWGYPQFWHLKWKLSSKTSHSKYKERALHISHQFLMTLYWLNLKKTLFNKSVKYRLKIGKKLMSQNVLLLAAIDDPHVPIPPHKFHTPEPKDRKTGHLNRKLAGNAAYGRVTTPHVEEGISFSRSITLKGQKMHRHLNQNYWISLSSLF